MIPFFKMLSPERFNDLKLGTLTMLKRNKSYMSTKYPKAATNTGRRKSCCLLAREDESVNTIADESFILVGSYYLSRKNFFTTTVRQILLLYCSRCQFIYFAICLGQEI